MLEQYLWDKVEFRENKNNGIKGIYLGIGLAQHVNNGVCTEVE